MSANVDLWNLLTHQIEWKIYSTKCLKNWNQNMVIIETVTSALPKILFAWNLPQRIQKQFSNLELLGVLPQLFEKVILKSDCIFCNNEGQKKIKEKGIWTAEATTMFECHCLKLQKIKRTRSSYGGSEVLISLHVKQVFAAAVAGSTREAQSIRFEDPCNALAMATGFATIWVDRRFEDPCNALAMAAGFTTIWGDRF